MPPAPLPLALAALTFVGAAGLGMAQSTGNPATIDQLSIPATASAPIRRVAPVDPATIAAQNLELRIQEAEDAAFAQALLQALLSNSIAPSPNPPIFIPKPPAVFSSYLTEVAPSADAPPQASVPRPPVVSRPMRPAAAPLPAAAPQRASSAATPTVCAPNSLSWSPACQGETGATSTAREAEIKTLEDGVYVKN